MSTTDKSATAKKTTMKRVAFTKNNYTQEIFDKYANYIEKNCVCGVLGKETAPDTGTPHIQGFINLKTPRQFSTLQKVFEGAHLEKAIADDEANFTYCTKSDPTAYKFGEPQNMGKRNDLDELKTVITAIKSGATKFQLMDQYPTTYSKHQRFIENYIQEYANASMEREEITSFRPWQQSLINTLEQPSDDRHIIWVYDPDGGIGKTRLARWLCDHKNAFYTNGGRSIDITYSYNHQPIVIFDFVRESQEFISYSTIEQLKNGILSSNKYQSCLKRFKSPHVVVFANFEPSEGKFSKDRVILLTPAKEQSVDFVAF